ncbi:hypothetical protein [Amaricoccus sp.]|uniref:hypothetical protein n=1 Tax=Amaricoccus sp. TaxID=1872485 RepID=UPI0033153DB3
MTMGAPLRGAALALLLALPALAQEPKLTVTLAPDGPVAVGTPIDVTATILVPTFMPRPPVWPDLRIADAITRLPERSTHPVTRRIGSDSWSGLSRTWEIIPQRPATYDLGPRTFGITYADPDTSQPRTATLDLPPVSFSAIVPAGAEDIDPFLAATRLALAITLDGLPADPKPGDAVTLTLTTTASGPPAMLLPPLADRLGTPAGLRAYPRQPVLVDGDPATRAESIAYVIQQPGSYVFPGITLDWWNTATASRETATTDPLTIDVPTPPGWHASGDRRSLAPIVWIAVALGAFGGGVTLLARRRRTPSASSARALRHRLLRSARHDPPARIRRNLLAWQSSLVPPLSPPEEAAIDAALRPLESIAYGRPDGQADETAARDALVRQLAAARKGSARGTIPALPALNPPLPERPNRPTA